MRCMWIRGIFIVIPPEYVKDSERMSSSEYEYQKSLKEVMLADVEYCMSNAENMEEFIWNLKELGHEVKQGKHLAIKAGGMKKFCRLDSLDERFSVEQIDETLAAIQGKNTTVWMASKGTICAGAWMQIIRGGDLL